MPRLSKREKEFLFSVIKLLKKAPENSGMKIPKGSRYKVEGRGIRIIPPGLEQNSDRMKGKIVYKFTKVNLPK